MSGNGRDDLSSHLIKEKKRKKCHKRALSCHLDTQRKIILALDLKLSDKDKIFGNGD